MNYELNLYWMDHQLNVGLALNKISYPGGYVSTTLTQQDKFYIEVWFWFLSILRNYSIQEFVEWVSQLASPFPGGSETVISNLQIHILTLISNCFQSHQTTTVLYLCPPNVRLQFQSFVLIYLIVARCSKRMKRELHQCRMNHLIL